MTPVFPADITDSFDLAHVFAGGRVEFTSDQHFGVGSNLILPGRGEMILFKRERVTPLYGSSSGMNMGDGWETRRSRQKDHRDWVIIKLLSNSTS